MADNTESSDEDGGKHSSCSKHARASHSFASSLLCSFIELESSDEDGGKYSSRSKHTRASHSFASSLLRSFDAVRLKVQLLLRALCDKKWREVRGEIEVRILSQITTVGS
jgi:hypothetical protein